MQSFQFLEFLSITYINVPVLASSSSAVKSCQYCKIPLQYWCAVIIYCLFSIIDMSLAPGLHWQIYREALTCLISRPFLYNALISLIFSTQKEQKD